MNRKSWPFDWLLSVSLRLVCCGIVSKIIVKTFASPKGYLSFSLFPLNHHNYFEKHSKQNEKKKTKQKKTNFYLERIYGANEPIATIATNESTKKSPLSCLNSKIISVYQGTTKQLPPPKLTQRKQKNIMKKDSLWDV